MTIIENFRQWVKEASFDVQAVSFELVNNNNDSSYVDIETTTVFARITLWSFGSCDVDVLDVESGKQIFWKNYEFDDWAAAYRVLTPFVEGILHE